MFSPTVFLTLGCLPLYKTSFGPIPPSAPLHRRKINHVVSEQTCFYNPDCYLIIIKYERNHQNYKYNLILFCKLGLVSFYYCSGSFIESVCFSLWLNKWPYRSYLGLVLKHKSFICFLRVYHWWATSNKNSNKGYMRHFFTSAAQDNKHIYNCHRTLFPFTACCLC